LSEQDAATVDEISFVPTGDVIRTKKGHTYWADITVPIDWTCSHGSCSLYLTPTWVFGQSQENLWDEMNMLKLLDEYQVVPKLGLWRVQSDFRKPALFPALDYAKSRLLELVYAKRPLVNHVVPSYVLCDALINCFCNPLAVSLAARKMDKRKRGKTVKGEKRKGTKGGRSETP
jgi:hypothetical protein